MASITIRQNESAVIPQGSNNPMVIEFDEPMTMPVLSISLWDARNKTALKSWSQDDVTIEKNMVICPLTEEETRQFPSGGMILEVKALDNNGYTVFWCQTAVNVVKRYDKDIDIVGGDP